jgi:hypothetical protein
LKIATAPVGMVRMLPASGTMAAFVSAALQKHRPSPARPDIGFGGPLRAFTRVSAKQAEWQAIDMEGRAPVVRDFSEADTDFRAVDELAKFVGERGNVFEEPVCGNVFDGTGENCGGGEQWEHGAGRSRYVQVQRAGTDGELRAKVGCFRGQSAFPERQVDFRVADAVQNAACRAVYGGCSNSRNGRSRVSDGCEHGQTLMQVNCKSIDLQVICEKIQSKSCAASFATAPTASAESSRSC